MLSTEEKRIRLEGLLARIRRNRNLFVDSHKKDDEEMDARPAIPVPMEPTPIRRISSMPKTSIPAAIVDVPMEPEPIPRDSLAPESEPAQVSALPKLSPVPVPMPEPKPAVQVSALPKLSPEPVPMPEPKPAVQVSALPKLSPEPQVQIPADAEPMLEQASVPIAVAKPKPAPVIIDEPPRIFEAHVQASSPIATVHGQAEREWTLRAVLERAWRLGQSDLDNN
jgi:hypothetical protein